MIRSRCIAPAVDQALEAKKRIPGMRRDDDESSIGGQDTARSRQRRWLIVKMFEHADEQNKLEAVAAMHAEIRCVARSKSQSRASRVPPRARDHRAAAIDTEPTRGDIGEVKQGLPGAAAEIEHARPTQITAERTKIRDARGKFPRARRSWPLPCIPAVSDKIEMLPRRR
jgi:hypothetical protein